MTRKNTCKALWLLPALVCACLIASCSTRKNTAATRNYQAFITRYNIYYNGDTHYRETLANMERNYEDDYSRDIFMHPVEAKADEHAPQPEGNFDRSIEKAQKAIQLRSIKKRPRKKAGQSNNPEYKAWMKRDEYNPFLHNAWMMMGRSQYFNGDFLGAASTFFYISRHFTWLPKTVTEAKLWQARAYTSLDWLYEAEMILTRIKPEQLSDKNLKGLYNFVYADYELHSGNYEGALPYLLEAVRHASGPQRTRLRFLLGQVYTRLGRTAEAYKAYKDAGSSASATYRTKFNARIKQSEVYAGNDITPEVNALKRMTRYDRNKEYLDQIYYAIGNLYLSRGDTAKAIENYRLAAEKSARNGIDKAISQITLGGLYFDLRQYDKAQPCYAEAMPMLPETYPDYKNLKQRSDVLDELAVYSQNLTLQDSLLRLADMTPEQRLAVVEKIIDELKKKEAEDAEAARREEYMANRDANSQLGNQAANAPNTFNINTDDSWYFYNTATRNAGKTEFQRRWGSRKLEDNWRRRNKTSFNLDDFSNDTDNEDDTDDPTATDNENDEADLTQESEESEHANDPHYPEYYLAQIPQTEQQIATAHEIIQESLYNMGVILKDKLDDYSAAHAQFDRLLADYPDNIYRLDSYYNLYLMAMRHDRRDEAEKWRMMILTDFADSPYGVALRDPDYIENLSNADANLEQLYAQAYDAYLDNRNDEVHDIYEKVRQQYPTGKILPKFMFLHALSYVTERRPDEFNATLRELLERYPDTDITPIASAWLKGMAQGRKLQSGTTNMRGMIWDMRLTNGSTALAADSAAVFDLNPDTRQLLVMTFLTDQVSTNQLLYDIARHNFRSFVVKDFDLEQMNFGRLGLIVIRDFDNLDELNHYRKVMADNPDFKLPRGVRPIAISAANFDKLLREGRSFDEYFRFLQEQNYVDTQQGLLQPEQVETLTEADEAASAPEPEPTSEPAPEPATAPATAPATQPLPEPAKPATTPAKPTTEPAKPDTEPAVAVPIPVPGAAKPPMPVYAPGSEGDDEDDPLGW